MTSDGASNGQGVWVYSRSNVILGPVSPRARSPSASLEEAKSLPPQPGEGGFV